MNAHETKQPEGSWGIVTVAESAASAPTPPPDTAAQAVWSELRYVWRPLSSLILPPRFQLELACITDRQGVRRFVPQNRPRTFVLQASLAGQAILEAAGLLDQKQRQSYRVMQLFFQQADHLQEHFGRSFERAQDLWVTASAGLGEYGVLPDDLGLDSLGRGSPWTIKELLDRGRESAIADGVVNLDEATCIRFGLLQAARNNPLEPENPGESRQLVQLGLFDLGPADRAIDAVTRALVTERLLAALKRHIGDSTDAFNRWFLDEIDNIVHQVAKKKKDGGQVDRAVVWQVLLEMDFDAYQYVAQGVSVAMRDFASATPVPLNTREREILEAMYFEKAALGGLSLILLHDRFSWIQETVKEMFLDPCDTQRFGVLLRLLDYVASMTKKRRQADRESKRKGLARNAQGVVAKQVPVDGIPIPDTSGRTPERFREIAAALRQTRNARCKCSSTEHWQATVAGDQDGIIVLNDGCSVCDHNETIRVTHDEIREIDQRLRDLE